MTSLGRISLIIGIFSTLLFATFDVKVSATKIHQGDQLIVTFVSDKSDDFPKIRDIGGVAIESSSQSASTSYINGRRSAEYGLRYIITPMQSFTIPSFTMTEEGKQVASQPINIEVVKRTQSVDSELFFDVRSDKKEVYIGEPFLVTLTYKQAKELDVIDIRLAPPTGKHFWIDTKNVKEEKSQTATHETTTLKYLFTAQKEGTLTIDPAHIQVGQRSYRRDAWGMLSLTPSYKSLFSDSITIQAKALPNGASTIGRFTLDVSADKTSSDEKDAVNVTINISGTGNIEDIAPFSLNIPNALVYDERPKKEFALKEGAFKGSFTQKFAIVSDTSYTIEPIEFSYFDKAKKEIVTLRSDPITITIDAKAKKESGQTAQVERAVETKDPIEPTDPSDVFGYFEAIGLLFIGALLGFLARSVQLPKRRKKVAKVKINSNANKALLQELLPFVHKDAKVKELMEALERSIYDNQPFDYKKSEVKKIIESVKKN